MIADFRLAISDFNAEKGDTQGYAEALCVTLRISFLCVKKSGAETY